MARKRTIESEAQGATHNRRLALERSSAHLGAALPAQAQLLLSLQQTAGNRAISGLVQRVRAGSDTRLTTQMRSPFGTLQRTIDQDARRWAMNWLATWSRPFPQAVKRFQLPKLYAICTSVMGEEQPAAPAAPLSAAELDKLRVDRARYTTALAAGLVNMGEKSAGELSARLVDGKPGLDQLMRELHGRIPEEIPQMTLATDKTAARHKQLQLEDPFLTLASGGAVFTFSREMAKHMMGRHHPRYLDGAPLQVQSFFDKKTTVLQIKAIIEGTVNKSKTDIAEWRRFRMTRGTDLASEAARKLDLRPLWDGRHWELTLTLDSANPQESRGKVAHFTPTL